MALALACSALRAADNFRFQCPENMPTGPQQKKALDDFLAWALQKYPGITLDQFVALRVETLEKYKCAKTLAFIKQNGARQLRVNAQTYDYEPAVVTLQGTLLSARGETPDGKIISFPALRLAEPITVRGKTDDAPTEKGVLLLHMNLNNKMMARFKSLKGARVNVTGSLYHSDNGNHQTNVLVTPTMIDSTQ